jgi:cytochrome oxidase Cu insertion factor (SCO1/SenC/PrrC family)
MMEGGFDQQNQQL